MIESLEFSDKVLAFGSENFVKNVVLPVSSELKILAKEYPITDVDDIEIDSQFTACSSEVSAFIAIMAIVGPWAANKFLDGIYNVVSKKIKSKLDTFIKSSKLTKKYSLSLIINSKSTSNSVVICCLGTNIIEIENSELLIPEVLKLSENHLNSTKSKKVHMYIIDNGKCNLKPYVHDSFIEAINELKNLYPMKLTKTIVK